MITGVHTLIFSTNPEADRAFFRDVLHFGYTDAGDGWLKPLLEDNGIFITHNRTG